MKTKEQILKNEVFKLSNLAGFELEVLDAMEIYKEQAVKEMHLNMQYYMEHCERSGYVTPQDWIENHKHF